jgi:hypothetical protein
LVTLTVTPSHSPRIAQSSERRRQALKLMLEFVLGQKWIMADATFGTFFGEVIEVFEDGAAGTVLITGDQENEVDTFTGTVAKFQASGEWRLLEG